MKLYLTHTPSSRKVIAVVNSLGLDIEMQFLDLMKGEQKAPDFIAINPNGKAPVLEDSDLKLWESNAICQYLVDKFAEGNVLFPKNLKNRIDIVRWQFWELTHFNKANEVLVWEKFIKPTFNMGETNAELVAVATQDFHTYAAVLDNHLSNNDYIVSNNATLADFSVASFSALYPAAQMPLDKYGNIKKWIQRLDEVPAWAKSAPPQEH